MTLSVGLFVFLISFVPFLGKFQSLSRPFTIYSEKILAAQSLPFVTNGAFNFWVLITWFNGIKDTAPFLLGISYRLWGYLMTSIFTLVVLYRLMKSFWTSTKSRDRISKKDAISSLQHDQHVTFFYALFLSAFASFLFLTKMHERYSMLPLPFLLLAAIDSRKLYKWFISLSILSFLNLYHSWPVPRIELLAKIIFYPPTAIVISAINVAVFLYLLKRQISSPT